MGVGDSPDSMILSHSARKRGYITTFDSIKLGASNVRRNHRVH